MSPRTVDRTARRAQLVAAAARVFAARGAAVTTVADIVAAAGVAQGTFYLYFDTKDDVIVAVVDAVAEGILAGLEADLAGPALTSAERITRFGRALATLSQQESLTSVADFLHRPENQRLHDRFAEHLLPRLVPLIARVISDGVADGSFDVDDPTTAAWFVLGGLRGIELAGTPLPDMPAALAAAGPLVLRTLGAR